MKLHRLLLAASAALSLNLAAQAEPNRPECIAPAQPGGGFDLTCKLAQQGLQALDLLPGPLRVTYMPGGIGAVAYNTVIANRPGDKDVIVAFSGGSLLNLAQSKFGRYTENDVRWLSAIATDYGMIAVRTDSSYQTLGDLIDALKQDPTSVVFGAGGTVGSQDWMKSVLVAKAAGIDFRAMRYVAFEGGGEAQTALLGGHIHAYSGDISETQGMLEGGQLRVLGVMADERLPAPFADIPTTKEQGYDVTWPIIRGFYVGPEVSDADYDWWVQAFERMLASDEFAELRTERALFPFSMTGAELDGYVKERVGYYRGLAEEFGLIQQ